MQNVIIAITEIMERIKSETGAINDADIARLLHVAPKKLAVWKLRNTIPYEALISFCRENSLGLEWVLTGEKAGRVAEPSVSYLPRINPSEKRKLKLSKMLIRIMDQGDEKKIKAVEAQLDLLDPGEKKQGVDSSKNAGVGS